MQEQFVETFEAFTHKELSTKINSFIYDNKGIKAINVSIAVNETNSAMIRFYGFLLYNLNH